MYAVISTGGKQYKISQGDTIRFEKIITGSGKISPLPVNFPKSDYQGLLAGYLA